MSSPVRIVIAFLFAWWVVLFQKPTALILIPFLYVISPVSIRLLISRLFQLNLFLVPLLLWFIFTHNPNVMFFGKQM